jgi:hypothetical protein
MLTTFQVQAQLLSLGLSLVMNLFKKKKQSHHLKALVMRSWFFKTDLRVV